MSPESAAIVTLFLRLQREGEGRLKAFSALAAELRDLVTTLEFLSTAEPWSGAEYQQALGVARAGGDPAPLLAQLRNATLSVQELRTLYAGLEIRIVDALTRANETPVSSPASVEVLQ